MNDLSASQSDDYYRLRADVERFLCLEADLLDAWKLEEWTSLFTEDATYLVPVPDEPSSNPSDTIFLVTDNMLRLRSRVRQLLGQTAWAENPRSRTRRLVTNIQVQVGQGEEIRASANFMLHRSRADRIDVFVGRYEYQLVRNADTFLIRHRKAILNQDSIRPQNKVSMIL
jgi:p-cumate 2,3-dioxygenase beta subunit